MSIATALEIGAKVFGVDKKTEETLKNLAIKTVQYNIERQRAYPKYDVATDEMIDQTAKGQTQPYIGLATKNPVAIQQQYPSMQVQPSPVVNLMPASQLDAGETVIREPDSEYAAQLEKVQKEEIGKRKALK